MQPGATIPLNKSSTYPSTEQTLSSLSVVLNAGGLGQIGDVVHNFNAILSGREGQLRDLLTRLDTFVGTFDGQRDNIVSTIEALDRFSGTLAAQDDVITSALRNIPPALDVLTRERPRLTTALTKLATFSDIAGRLVHDSKADLVTNLRNLEPTTRAIADVGPDLDTALADATIYPFNQNFIDRGVRGDYVNVFATVDLTAPRLRRTLFLGTHGGREGQPLTPEPGDPSYLRYTYDPLGAGVTPPPPNAAPAAPEPGAPEVSPGGPAPAVQPPPLTPPGAPPPGLGPSGDAPGAGGG